MLKATQNIGKVLHKVFKTVVKDILQDLSPLGESGSKVSYFVPEPRNFAEVTKFSDYINKTWLKATQKGDRKYNQQSYFSSWRAGEGWICDSMHGYLQS